MKILRFDQSFILFPKKRKPSKTITSLKPVFEKLIYVHQRYIAGEKGKGDDHPYWYTERPHVGLFAAAVWLSGGTALEEYKTKKSNKHKSNYGRCDLGFRIGKLGFECEAKRLWLALEYNSENLANTIYKHKQNGLDQVIEDVKKLQNKDGLGFCFVIPGIRKSKFPDLNEILNNLIGSLQEKNSGWDALVWIGVSKWQAPKEEKDFFFPGVLLLIKQSNKN